jgi:hypothetical protein
LLKRLVAQRLEQLIDFGQCKLKLYGLHRCSLRAVWQAVLTQTLAYRPWAGVSLIQPSRNSRLAKVA